MTVVATAALVAVGQNGASATHLAVDSVRGSAFGYWADNISLFGGAQADTGPTPTVTLASDASNSPQTASAPCGQVAYGPANLFTSDTITVDTVGSLGTTGSVTSESSVANINKKTDPACAAATGSELFTADSLTGTATADETGTTGDTTVVGGIVDTHSNSYNCTSLTTPCGGHTHSADNPLTDLDESLGQVAVPGDPAVNLVIEGHVHLSDTSTDYYVIVFNEQITNPDGSISVNAVHEYFGAELQPNGSGAYVDLDGNRYDIVDVPSVLQGDLFLGQVTAGVSTVPAPTTTTSTTTSTTTTLPPPPARDAVTDFDGDGDTDRSVYRKGAWYVHGQPTAFLGRAGDVPVPADYDGDGDDDRAVYRNGAWYVEGQPTVFLGTSTDIPVPGDYDGDGDDERAVFRPSVGAWHVEGQPAVYHGASSDIPVPADYDGDGDTDRAVFRPSVGGWFVAGQTTQYLGLSGDIPVPGDYDGDGDTDRGIWRPRVGGWFIAGQSTQYMGLEGDVPVPGDYDGDGDTDRGIWRPSVGAWHIVGQSTVYLGAQGDTPLPLPAAIYRTFF